MDNTFKWDEKDFAIFLSQKLRWDKSQLEKYISEFKESKQPKKDWEIVALKDYKNEGEYYRELSGCLWSNSLINKRYPLNTLLELNYPIHSVRRLSDNEVFSINQEVQYVGS